MPDMSSSEPPTDVQTMRENLQALQQACASGTHADQLATFSAALDVALSRWPEIDEPYSY